LPGLRVEEEQMVIDHEVKEIIGYRGDSCLLHRLGHEGNLFIGGALPKGSGLPLLKTKPKS